jgi:lysyl-tRNA synthetase class 2
VGLLDATRRSPWVPRLAALVAAALGAYNLVVALDPDAALALVFGRRPFGEMPVFHALVVPVSATLLAASYFLWRGRRTALHVAMATLCVLVVLDLVRGLHVEEALVTAAGALLLWVCRDSFRVRHDPARLRSALWRLPLLALGTVVVAFASVSVAAPQAATGDALREALALLAWSSGSVDLGEHAHAVSLGIGLLAIAALFAAAWLVFRPLAAPRALPDPEVRRLVGGLVRRHGADTLAFFKLRRDQQYLVSPTGRAFLGYRLEGGVMLVAGDPVGPPDELDRLVDQASSFAAERDLRVGVVGASVTGAALFERIGLHRFYLGDEAIVDTATFSLEGRAIRKVRQSVTRLEREGFSFELVELGSVDEQVLASLGDVSSTWLEGGEERGFSMALDRLGGEEQHDTILAIARDNEGVPRGFLQFVPSFGRAAVSLSFMRRDPATPNGLTEFLVARSLVALRERGVEEASLNFAAFARILVSPASRVERGLGRLVRLTGPMFQIESLYRFNAKFDPRWEPRYLLYAGRLGLARAGLAAARAEGQIPRLPSLRDG